MDHKTTNMLSTGFLAGGGTAIMIAIRETINGPVYWNLWITVVFVLTGIILITIGVVLIVKYNPNLEKEYLNAKVNCNTTDCCQ